MFKTSKCNIFLGMPPGKFCKTALSWQLPAQCSFIPIIALPLNLTTFTFALTPLDKASLPWPVLCQFQYGNVRLRHECLNTDAWYNFVCDVDHPCHGQSCIITTIPYIYCLFQYQVAQKLGWLSVARYRES